MEAKCSQPKFPQLRAHLQPRVHDELRPRTPKALPGHCQRSLLEPMMPGGSGPGLRCGLMVLGEIGVLKGSAVHNALDFAFVKRALLWAASA